MLHFKLMALVALAVTTDCQVSFPSSRPKPSITTKIHESCTASNGRSGSCHEFRSAEFKECSFFPSTDTSDPEVADHLSQNTCRNDGSEIYFCCPSSRSQLLDDVIPKEHVCGTSFRENVVGGNLTSEGDWPWLASIGRITHEGYISCCGGTLITKQHVISAAHCFTPRAKEICPNAFLRLGEYNVNVDNDGAQDYNITIELSHEYNRVTGENDIILLKLDRPVTSFTDFISPACLPYHLRNDNFNQKQLIVVGWGIFDNRLGIGSPAPLEGRVPVVPISECKEKYGPNSPRKIDNRQLCAGTGGTDSCNGDSGGPLNYLDVKKGLFYVVGVVSFGPRFCGSDSLPGVYARVGHYIDWIEENLIKLL